VIPDTPEIDVFPYNSAVFDDIEHFREKPQIKKWHAVAALLCAFLVGIHARVLIAHRSWNWGSWLKIGFESLPVLGLSKSLFELVASRKELPYSNGG